MTEQNHATAEAKGLGKNFLPQLSRAPVFIVGCPRSGTSYLYHLLLSASGFAEFPTQMNVYDVLEPIYGDLGVLRNKRAALAEWRQSKGGQVAGIDHLQLQQKILDNCHSAGDFLAIIMEEIAHSQGVKRWIDSTPTNIPHMLRIHREFPDALFVHIIRDPRDVVLSLDKRGWTRPLPWDRRRSLLAGALYWEWIVRKGQVLGSTLSRQYMEVRYEALVQNSHETLTRVGEFLGCEVNYDRVQQTLKNPFTSFPDDAREGRVSPVGRWKEKFPPDELRDFEILIGPFMEELGYPPSVPDIRRLSRTRHRAMRGMYRLFYPFKQWLKTHTPLSRWMVDYSEILINK